MDLSKKSTQINNSNTLEALDCISRKMASEGIARLARNKFSLDDSYGFYLNGLKDADYLVSHLPPVQSERTNCEYCHTDRDGYVLPLEKNCHAYISFGMHGWVIELKANGWRGEAKIKYCPICGRRLTDG